MSRNEIEALTKKVTDKKNALREALLREKCSRMSREQNRIILPKEITLSTEEKALIMREAFDAVLIHHGVEEKIELKKIVGKELNRRKQDRKFGDNTRLSLVVAEIEKREMRVSLAEEITTIIKEIREQEECQLAIELLLASGGAVRTEHGDLMFFDVADNEE